MGVFFQLVQHDVTGVFKQIHGTPFSGTFVPQLAKFGRGVDRMDELVRMEWACFIQEVVQVRLHLIQVMVFRVPYFGGRLGGDRPFLHTFLPVVF